MEESTWHGEYNQEEHRRKRRRKETEEEFLENFENKNIHKIVAQSVKSQGIVQQRETRAREQIAAKKPHTMKNCAWHALYDKYLHHDGTGKVNCSKSNEGPRGEWNLLQHTLHGHANPPIPFGRWDACTEGAKNALKALSVCKRNVPVKRGVNLEPPRGDAPAARRFGHGTATTTSNHTTLRMPTIAQDTHKGTSNHTTLRMPTIAQDTHSSSQIGENWNMWNCDQLPPWMTEEDIRNCKNAHAQATKYGSTHPYPQTGSGTAYSTTQNNLS